MTFDRKKYQQAKVTKRMHTVSRITESQNSDTRDKQLAMQKKNAMAIFGALLLLAPEGKTYKVKLQNPKWTTKQLNAWLLIANRECGTEASIVTDADGNVPRRDGCIFVAL